MDVCVFCSATNGLPASFVNAAQALGKGLAEQGHTLVYGGGKVGLMGELAIATQAAGGEVVGIIPKALAKREVAYKEADELIVCADMLSRKDIMMQRSQCFVALPGGLGTLDEIFEVLTHRQLGYHQYPTYLVNINGFFDSLHQLIQSYQQQNLIKTPLHHLYQLVPDVASCLEILAPANV